MPNINTERKHFSQLKEGAACMTRGQNDTITPTMTPVANKTEVTSISPTTKPEQTSAGNRLNITTLTSGPIDALITNVSVNNVTIGNDINRTTTVVRQGNDDSNNRTRGGWCYNRGK